jgi:cell division transport system permease protein
MSQIDSIAARRTKPNYLYAIVSVALVLFLLGFFGLLIINAQQLVKRYKEQVNLIVATYASIWSNRLIPARALFNGSIKMMRQK